MTQKEEVLQKQEGGRHYKQFKIEPVEYIAHNNIPFMEGNAIKYISTISFCNVLFT